MRLPAVPPSQMNNSEPGADLTHESTQLLTNGSVVHPFENTSPATVDNKFHSCVHDVHLPIPNPVYYNLESEESESDESDDETPEPIAQSIKEMMPQANYAPKASKSQDKVEYTAVNVLEEETDKGAPNVVEGFKNVGTEVNGIENIPVEYTNYLYTDVTNTRSLRKNSQERHEMNLGKIQEFLKVDEFIW